MPPDPPREVHVAPKRIPHAQNLATGLINFRIDMADEYELSMVNHYLIYRYRYILLQVPCTGTFTIYRYHV